MTPEFQIVLVFVLFLVLLATGMAVPFAILLPGIVYLWMQGGMGALHGLGLVSWGSMDSYTLTAIPLFVLMAEFLQGSGVGLRVYNGLARLVHRVPGGLLQTNIAGCAIFAAISGSSVVTAASIGRVALPELAKRNYSPRLSAAARLASQLVFDFISLLASVLVTWQLYRLAANSWHSADVAPTPLQTPLWLPQCTMAIGMALLCLALVRAMLAKARILSRGVAS